jgi:anti-sigma B factor antagonist
VTEPGSGLALALRDDVVVACVKGSLDLASAEQARGLIGARLEGSEPGLVVDLSEATYLDSSGIEFLFDLGRRLRTRRQRLGLVVPEASPIARIVRLANLSSVAIVCETLDAAVKGVRVSV